MEQKQLTNRIEKITQEISRLTDIICTIKALDVRLAPEAYEDLSVRAALSAETVACRLRSLIYATTHVKKLEYLVRASEAHGIQISEKDGVLQITLPCLLPSKRSRLGSLFLSDPLYAALERYTEHRTAPRFQKCLVCFCHVYDKNLFPRQALDPDNFLQKQILDVVATFLLTDDSGRFCDMYITSEPGQQSCTHIFLMQKEHFPAWLAGHRKEQKSI